MSFKARERKRKQRAAQQKAQHKVRTQDEKKVGRAAPISRRKSPAWWLTITATDTCCAECGGVLRQGRQMVYRATPREARCVPCAEADPAIRYRPSVRWEAAKLTEVERRAERARKRAAKTREPT